MTVATIALAALIGLWLLLTAVAQVRTRRRWAVQALLPNWRLYAPEDTPTDVVLLVRSERSPAWRKVRGWADTAGVTSSRRRRGVRLTKIETDLLLEVMGDLDRPEGVAASGAHRLVADRCLGIEAGSGGVQFRIVFESVRACSIEYTSPRLAAPAVTEPPPTRALPDRQPRTSSTDPTDA